MCLQREDDGFITTSVFRKATHTNQYLSFDSHHPVAHKAAVVRTLMCRASALSSNGVERVAEEKKVMEALRDNGYPSGFVHRHSDNMAPRRREDDQGLPRTSLTLPYISGLSETVRRVLRPLDIKMVFRPLHTLRHQLVHPKDPVPMDQRTGVVYQIPCSDPKLQRALQNGYVALRSSSQMALPVLSSEQLLSLHYPQDCQISCMGNGA